MSREAAEDFSRGREPPVGDGRIRRSQVTSPLQGLGDCRAANRGLAPPAKILRRFAAHSTSATSWLGQRRNLRCCCRACKPHGPG